MKLHEALAMYKHGLSQGEFENSDIKLIEFNRLINNHHELINELATFVFDEGYMQGESDIMDND